MDSAPKRPWDRLCGLTWFVMGVVICAFISRQFEEEFPLWSRFGWPLGHDYEWRGWQLVGNCLFGTLFVGSTAFVCEAWVRSQRRWQFRLRHVLVVTAVLSVLMALCESDFRGTWWSVVDWFDFVHPVRWPILFALACTIYTVGWLVARATSRLYKLAVGGR